MMASIRRRCSGVILSERSRVPRTSSLTTFPDSCHSLSITGCSFLYFSIISRNINCRCRCFLFRRRLRALWCFLALPSWAKEATCSSSFTTLGRLLTDVDCSVVRNRGRRGSIDRLIEQANLISSFSGCMLRYSFATSTLILRSK
jgi:hypothetical protein